MTAGILIIGTGGTCIDILEIAEDRHRAGLGPPCIGFVAVHDDAPKSLESLPVWREADVGSLDADALFVNGTGSPNTYAQRGDIPARLALSAKRFVTLVHPSAYVSSRAVLGRGVVIFPQAVVHARAVIGDHALVLSRALIGHDCRVGDHCIVAAGAQLTGRVAVGTTAYIGANATVLGDLSVGAQSLVGAGSVVTRDVTPRQVVAGVPARWRRNIT
ncbi:MAG: acetyltransferase [Myxococcales bacterium]|nr:acetyltransferase [Myxococcales bacterium]